MLKVPMKVDHRQEFEMAEIPSDVYDIFHPTPVSLKDLAAIAVSLEMWRCKLNEYRRQSGKLDSEFLPLRIKERFSAKTVLPDLPSAISKTIEEYLFQFALSLESWHWEHYEKVLFRFKNRDDILEHFDNFVCDYDGNIDYVRTAKRMICCDRFNEEEKFIIACMYSFEDDIIRIWPSVSSKMHLSRRTFGQVKSKKVHLDALEFDDCPLLYYWICRRTNQLHKIPTKPNSTIDETMFDACIPYHYIGRSMVYFWNRIRLENQVDRAADVFDENPVSFAKFILPKMGRQLFDSFVTGLGEHVMTELCNYSCGKRFGLGTWLHIRNVIGDYGFAVIIVELLQKDIEYSGRVHRQYMRRVVWNNAPLHLKRSVIRNISSDMLEENLYRVEETRHDDDDDDDDGDDHDDFDYSTYINVEFLLIVLEYATLEERTTFWRNCWRTVISLIPGEDVQHLQRIIKLCIEDDDEISRFKRNVLTESDLVRKKCVLYLTNADLDISNKFVNFCFPELPTARTFKQQLLRLAFLDENCPLNSKIVSDLDVFNAFIDEAYQDADSSTDFKNKFVSSPSNQLRLCKLTCSGKVSLEELVKFIHTLRSTELTVSQIKMRMRGYLEKQFGRTRSCNRIKLMGSRYLPISSWCSEQTEEFEATSSVNTRKRKKK
ncbi:uncharacterized protein LOC135843017 [Planococcus citri]|uniref:uncharacterized protein LOC135843017 n=1 Tax=Planococcus citri TaxID=170843 RepID=UPI0031F88D96